MTISEVVAGLERAGKRWQGGGREGQGSGVRVAAEKRWRSGVYGTVESIVKMIEEGEDTDTPVNRTEMRDQLVENMKEMFKAYFELVEQHDRLVGANNTLTMGSTQLPNQQKSSSPSVNQETKPEARMQLLKENEIQVANTQYNGLAERLHNVESELSKIKVDLAKKEDLLFVSEKLNYQQKSNLESLRQKVELQEEELKQKREEIERIKPRLSELEMHKSNWDNKMSVLEEENKYLNIQKVSHEEKISNLLKDLSLEKEVVLHLRDKENLQRDLSSQISEVSKVNAMHKGELMKCEIEKKILSEKNSVLESTLLKANIEFDALKEKVFALEGNIEILTRTINAYLKKNNTVKVSLSNLKTEAKFLKTKSSGKDGKEGKEGILQNLIAEKQTIFAQVHLLEEQMKKLNETIEEAKCAKHDAESTIDTLNVNIERFNVQKPYSGLITYDFLISMRIWKEFDVFLNKMPIWRKMRDRIESGVGARILDSSHSKSKNDPRKIKDGSDVELKEVGQSEMEMQKELQSKREGSKKIAELQQQERKEQVEPNKSSL
ncbi:hypothetical protein FCM35_KLT08357 [Carex littledalei]|uniref:NAB domain-containing protein n=1 Tax=Carex littledalei TaxID=544730 RepID=A0A833V6U3_9POAL|nr:hypothetical protein FCM35_KLT08357 [Carex littledalei]